MQLFLVKNNLMIPPPPRFCSESLGRLIGPSLGRLPILGKQVIDPPRGRPIGGGGAYRLWGCGGDIPHPHEQDPPP